jgi:hypothetical protein
MKLLLLLLLPCFCQGQFIQKRIPAAKTVIFKPGQNENLLKVTLLHAVEWESDRPGYQADYYLNTMPNLINFPEYGKVYTVVKKVNDGYKLLELKQDLYYDCRSFKVVTDKKVVNGL